MTLDKKLRNYELNSEPDDYEGDVFASNLSFPERLLRIDPSSAKKRLEWIEKNKKFIINVIAYENGAIKSRKWTEPIDANILNKIVKLAAEQMLENLVEQIKWLDEQGLESMDAIKKFSDSEILAHYPEMLVLMHEKNSQFIDEILNIELEEFAPRNTGGQGMRYNIAQKVFLEMIYPQRFSKFNSLNKASQESEQEENFVAFFKKFKSLIFTPFKKISNYVAQETQLIDYCFNEDIFCIFAYLNFNDLNETQKEMAIVAAILNLEEADIARPEYWPLCTILDGNIETIEKISKAMTDIIESNKMVGYLEKLKIHDIIKTVLGKRKLEQNLILVGSIEPKTGLENKYKRKI